MEAAQFGTENSRSQNRPLLYTTPSPGPFGRNQACLEEDVHQWVGSTDPVPMTTYITLTIYTYTLHGMDLARGTYILVVCVCSSVHARFHPILFVPLAKARGSSQSSGCTAERAEADGACRSAGSAGGIRCLRSRARSLSATLSDYDTRVGEGRTGREEGSEGISIQR